MKISNFNKKLFLVDLLLLVLAGLIIFNGYLMAQSTQVKLLYNNNAVNFAPTTGTI